VFKSIGISFCALIFLAGCATTPNQPDEIISPATPSPGAAALNWTDPNLTHNQVAFHPGKPSTPEVKISLRLPVAPQAARTEPLTTWTALYRWTAQHKIEAPHFLSNTPMTTYAVSSINGVMVLAIGSHEATWNGVEIHLAFEPQIIDGGIFLHGLDLQKNLEPLLCAPPLTFSTNRVIVIDPGHGGSNPGTVSVLDGRLEKEFTLDWARRLAPLLETNGWKVFLTRTSDVTVSNSDRVVFAEAHHADLFMSLHFNSTYDRDKNTGGLETYCITPTGMPSTLTRGYADPLSEHLPNNAFDAQNLQLAVRIHSALLHATGIEDRGVRRSRFNTVLRGQNRPAILIEAGYLSNPDEAKLIESAEYRQKLAEAVANALK
jgi:N-acetylmuramoyl-L-alanine amidase